MDINATQSPLTGPLTHYLRASTPTKSFLQISQSSGIPLSDIKLLASHLIYWRRARAIPPLRQGDTYIVSPNADMQRLASASSSFAKVFSTLPSLPRILNMLSSTPRPYSTIIPSKDHKEMYLEILAWLLRNGWVTQLRTFAWIRVPSNIKETVTKQAEMQASAEQQNDTTQKLTRNAKESSLSPISSSFQSLPPTKPEPGSQLASASILSSPLRVSSLCSRYLAAISSHLLSKQGTESHGAWGKCVQYFDGRHALEDIAIMEGWKRKRVAELIAGWEAEGVLVKGRHW